MKRFRVKLVGVSFAALAGSSLAADDLPVIPVAPAPPAAVVLAGGEPTIPTSVRFVAASAPTAAPEPIWLPAAKTRPPVVELQPTPSPAAVSDFHPAPTRPIVPPIQLPAAQPSTPGPRVGAIPPERFRETPDRLPPAVPPANNGVIPVPAAPAESWRRTEIEQPKPPMVDAPVQPERSMLPPVQPETIRPRVPDSLPPPRSTEEVVPPAEKELPVAPPELMIPDCTPGKHGTFGSPPIRLSRDYPPLSELCGHSIRDWFGARHATGRAAGSRGFVQGEYLLWWVPGLRIPILATTNPNPGAFGFLGEPGTVSILGPGDFIGSTRQGFRVRGGLWLDDCGSCGIDGSVFFLGRRTADAVFSSSEFGIITRPIFSPNVRPGGGVIGETGQAVTVPNVLAGGLTAHAESFLWGADVNARHCLWSGCDWKLMGFAGYRFLNLSEELSVTENIFVIGQSPRVQVPDPVGSVVFVQDKFETENWFNGGQIGLTYERRRGNWSVDARTSIAFGVTHQELDINGIQVRTRPGQPPMTFQGGLLAAGPNLGHFERDRFSIVPEATINVGYWLTQNLKAYVGYNFLYWTNVIRPGDQIDRVVDLTFVPNAPPVPPSGQLRPQPLFNQSDLWVTGINFGVEWRW